MNDEDALLEAQAATVAFHTALARMGVETLVEAIALFRRLSADDLSGTAGGWLDDAITMVTTHRARSQELAIAYFRLFRALRTGTTIPDPRDPEPAYVTLSDLRDEFDRLLEDDDRIADDDIDINDVDDDIDINTSFMDEKGETFEAEPAEESELPDTIPDDIPIEADWSDAEGDPLQDFLDELDTQDDAAGKILEDLLTDTVADNYQKGLERAEKVEKRRGEQEGKKARQKARESAESMASGYSQMVTLNAARGALQYLTYRDRRVIGYARVSKTGTPCAFCAMLISRGVVYKSLKSAGGGFYDKGDEYHPNCQCCGLPVYRMRDYESMSIFDMNRQLGEEWYDGPTDEDWDRVTERSSNERLSAWRHYWKRRLRELERAA